MDFRDLNKLLVPKSQPFPLFDDIIVKTRNCEWFSVLHSIPIRVEDRRKTDSVTQNGHYEWSNLTLSLKNSSTILQRILSVIIRMVCKIFAR